MQTTIRIEGMTCRHCVQAVWTALAGVEGVERAEVGIGAATLEHDGRATPEAIRAAVEVAGYRVSEATEERRRLRVL